MLITRMPLVKWKVILALMVQVWLCLDQVLWTSPPPASHLLRMLRLILTELDILPGHAVERSRGPKIANHAPKCQRLPQVSYIHFLSSRKCLLGGPSLYFFWRKLCRRGKAPRYFIWTRRGLHATGVDPRLFDPVPSGDIYITLWIVRFSGK